MNLTGEDNRSKAMSCFRSLDRDADLYSSCGICSSMSTATVGGAQI